jgi:dienelactone hydrolase
MNSAPSTARVDHIPVLWFRPDPAADRRQLALWIPYFTGRKEDMEPHLRDLAARGFTAASFDPWQHGERASESMEALRARAFSDYRRHLWPLFGHTALETLRVIDWAVVELGVGSEIRIGGISMGGVAAVAAAGIDGRIARAAVIGAGPDWLRLGADLPPGKPDAYARFFYDRLNPATHPEGFRRMPAIAFECGAEDRHVPPDGASAFRDALREAYRSHPDRIRVTLHPGAGHTTTVAMWANCLEWLCATQPQGNPPSAPRPNPNPPLCRSAPTG